MVPTGKYSARDVGQPVVTAPIAVVFTGTHPDRHADVRWLRTSLTEALDGTKNLRAVMAFARHNKPDVTAGYTRTTNEQLRRVSDALKF